MRSQREKREKLNAEKLLSDKDVSYIRELIIEYVMNLNRRELMAMLKDFNGRRLRKVLHPVLRVWSEKGKE